MEREYNIPKDQIKWDYSWEDVQFRIHQLPRNTLLPNFTLYDKKVMSDLFNEVLCDRKEQTISTLKQEYEIFQKRLDKNRGG